MSELTESAAWQALAAHYQANKDLLMRDLFASDQKRFQRFSRRHGDILVDFSKNRITDATLRRLLDLARERQVEEWRDRMFAGERINVTEDRPALHVALRNRSSRPMNVDGADVMPAVQDVLERMAHFVERVHRGEWTGFDDRPIEAVVNIGIGGSDLGPAMVTEALAPYRTHLRVRFVSNVDAAHLRGALVDLDPATTLFVVASKTFSTQETLLNARAAREWVREGGAEEADIARHFVAVSTNRAAVVDFGIDPAHMFEFWDWVGGRYSLWSAIGLPIALAVGMDRFEALLGGAHEMDEHFRQTALPDNIPVILALIGIWYNDFFGAQSHAVLPYAQDLRRLPAYLQQADMESNGKSVTRAGEPVDYETGPILWGEPGTNGQHAFYQLLHQGTKLIPVDFIAFLETHYPDREHHRILLANCLAQGEALMRGRTRHEVKATPGTTAEATIDPKAHRVFEGNRPSNTLVFPRLDPHHLGALIALYEHKIFVQGVIWGINSFDQWGVELGKQLAQSIRPELEPGSGAEPSSSEPTNGAGGIAHDASTQGLIDYFLAYHNEAVESDPP